MRRRGPDRADPALDRVGAADPDGLGDLLHVPPRRRPVVLGTRVRGDVGDLQGLPGRPAAARVGAHLHLLAGRECAGVPGGAELGEGRTRDRVRLGQQRAARSARQDRNLPGRRGDRVHVRRGAGGDRQREQDGRKGGGQGESHGETTHG